MPGTDIAEQGNRSEHLALVRSLSREVATAISAIEHNDLALLKSSVAAQESICQKLSQDRAEWLRTACASYRASSGNREGVARWQEVRDAHAGLARLNRIYEGLIRRSHKSIQLITALYRGREQDYSKEAKLRAGNHTWSCEV